MIEDLKQGFTSQEPITCLAFDPQEKKAYLRDGTGTILIFDLVQGEEVTKFDVASEPIKALQKVKEHLLIFAKDQVVCWDLQQMKRVYHLQLPILDISRSFHFEYQDGIFSDDGKYLIVEKLQDFLYSSLHSMDLKTGEITGTRKGEICIFRSDEAGFSEALREQPFSKEIVGMQASRDKKYLGVWDEMNHIKFFKAVSHD